MTIFDDLHKVDFRQKICYNKNVLIAEQCKPVVDKKG